MEGLGSQGGEGNLVGAEARLEIGPGRKGLAGDDFGIGQGGRAGKRGRGEGDQFASGIDGRSSGILPRIPCRIRQAWFETEALQRPRRQPTGGPQREDSIGAIRNHGKDTRKLQIHRGERLRFHRFIKCQDRFHPERLGGSAAGRRHAGQLRGPAVRQSEAADRSGAPSGGIGRPGGRGEGPASLRGRRDIETHRAAPGHIRSAIHDHRSHRRHPAGEGHLQRDIATVVGGVDHQFQRLGRIGHRIGGRGDKSQRRGGAIGDFDFKTLFAGAESGIVRR